MNFHWDWASLIQISSAAIISWLMGCLGIGPKPVTPARIVNNNQDNTLK